MSVLLAASPPQPQYALLGTILVILKLVRINEVVSWSFCLLFSCSSPEITVRWGPSFLSHAPLALTAQRWVFRHRHAPDHVQWGILYIEKFLCDILACVLQIYTLFSIPCLRHFCPLGSIAPVPCPAGTYGSTVGIQVACVSCPTGYG